MTHLQDRLTERGLNGKITDSELYMIASHCSHDTAVILHKLDSPAGDCESSYYKRTESNGELVVLIVRKSRAVTIMYRRSSQTNTTSQLRVSEIIDLTN